MGGGLEVDLTHGAVANLWGSVQSALAAARPVLQVVDVQPAAEATERYSLVLSDGVHFQHGMLAASINRLARDRDGSLRAGDVVRLLDYISDAMQHDRRTIVVIQLEILQTECALIGSPELYEPNRTYGEFVARSTAYSREPYSDGYAIHRSCSASGGEGMSSSYIAPTGEPAVWKMVSQIKDENLGFSGRPDWIIVKGNISFIKTKSLCYTVCRLIVMVGNATGRPLIMVMGGGTAGDVAIAVGVVIIGTSFVL